MVLSSVPGVDLLLFRQLTRWKSRVMMNDDADGVSAHLPYELGATAIALCGVGAPVVDFL